MTMACEPDTVNPICAELGKYMPVLRLDWKFNEGLDAEPGDKVMDELLFALLETATTFVPSQTRAYVAPLGMFTVAPPLTDVLNVSVYVPVVEFVIT